METSFQRGNVDFKNVALKVAVCMTGVRKRLVFASRAVRPFLDIRD